MQLSPKFPAIAFGTHSTLRALFPSQIRWHRLGLHQDDSPGTEAEESPTVKQLLLKPQGLSFAKDPFKSLTPDFLFVILCSS